MNTDEEIIRWFVTGDVGVSSKAVVAQMTGSKTRRDGFGDHPYDNGDFGRCHKLLEAVPKFKVRIEEMSGRSPEWAALVAHWDELTKLYLSGEKMSSRITQILDAVPGKNGADIGSGVTIYVGKDT